MTGASLVTKGFKRTPSPPPPLPPRSVCLIWCKGCEADDFDIFIYFFYTTHTTSCPENCAYLHGNQWFYHLNLIVFLPWSWVWLMMSPTNARAYTRRAEINYLKVITVDRELCFMCTVTRTEVLISGRSLLSPVIGFRKHTHACSHTAASTGGGKAGACRKSRKSQMPPVRNAR